MKFVVAIVDDDESVRAALASLMNSLGYHAIAYSSADEFIRSGDRGRTGCLITDVNMPGMSGPQLYERLLRLGERIPTIFLTAFPKEQDRERAIRMEQWYLTKPFREEELLVCVRSALDRTASKSS